MIHTIASRLVFVPHQFPPVGKFVCKKGLFLLLVCLLLSATSATAFAQIDYSVEIGSGIVDDSRVNGRKWERVNVVPLTAGEHTIRVMVDSDADIRFSVFRRNLSTIEKLATTGKQSELLEWTGTLHPSNSYYIGVWSVSGSTNFKVTLESLPILLTATTSDQTVLEGQDVTFSVQADGEGPLTYQWFRADSPIQGANQDRLLVENASMVDDSVEYAVIVTDSFNNMTVASATLTVVEAPDPVTITRHPADQTVTEGGLASFSVSAVGTGDLRYQWFSDNRPIEGANSSSLSIEQVSISDSSKAFSVMVIDDNGSIDSDFALLRVERENPSPVSSLGIGKGLLDHTRQTGPSSARHDFTSLTDGEHSIFLSWTGDANLNLEVFEADGTPLNSAINGFNPLVWSGDLEADTAYYVLLRSTQGSTDYALFIEASISISIDRQPAAVSVIQGGDAAFSVSASGSGDLAFQWFADGDRLNGETADSLTVLAAELFEDGTRFTVEVTNGFETVLSNPAVLSVEAALSAISVTASETWNVAGEVHRLITTDDTVYVGGEFSRIYAADGRSLLRTNIAAFNRLTGAPIDFAPILDGDVRALALSPDEKTLYVGGAFQTVNGQNRSRVVAFDLSTGRVGKFNPPVINRALRAIAVTEDKIYLGGLFNKVGASSKSFVAAFNPETGALDTNFNAVPDGSIKALVAGEEGLWIGGDFRAVNRQNQRGVALVDVVYGSLESSDDASADVIDLAATDDQLFIAIGGPGGSASAFSRVTRSEQWSIRSDGNFQGVAVDKGRYVYFGGHYEIVEGNSSADRMTRHDKLTGEMDLSWLPNINGIRSVNAIEVREDGLYFGGDFTRVGNKPHEGFAVFKGLTR